MYNRYYDPKVGRFISRDNIDALIKNQSSITNKNLFAYCDNNPLVRMDCGGEFWESIWDVASWGASVVEVAVNPTDLWAWAGLVGDTVDLIPFVTGVGEVTRAVKTTSKIVDKSNDVVSAAKTLYKQVPQSSDIRKSVGSYEILYKSGKNYIGKGKFQRAIASAIRNTKDRQGNMVDSVIAIRWKSAPNHREAFIDEYLMQLRFCGVKTFPTLPTYNKIWSPGRKYYKK